MHTLTRTKSVKDDDNKLFSKAFMHDLVDDLAIAAQELNQSSVAVLSPRLFSLVPREENKVKVGVSSEKQPGKNSALSSRPTCCRFTKATTH